MAQENKRFIPDSQLREWFGFHPANTDRKQAAHQTVRMTFYALSLELNNLLPEGSDKTTTLRALQKAAMEANACLAIGGGPLEDYDFDTAHIAPNLVELLENHYPGDPTSPVA